VGRGGKVCSSAAPRPYLMGEGDRGGVGLTAHAPTSLPLPHVAEITAPTIERGSPTVGPAAKDPATSQDEKGLATVPLAHVASICPHRCGRSWRIFPATSGEASPSQLTTSAGRPFQPNTRSSRPIEQRPEPAPSRSRQLAQRRQPDFINNPPSRGKYYLPGEKPAKALQPGAVAPRQLQGLMSGE